VSSTQENPCSKVHNAEQPSLSNVLPSSHSSEDNFTPSPHIGVQTLMLAVHV